MKIPSEEASFPVSKDDLRPIPAADHSALVSAAGRMAEALRRDPAYRAAAALYVEPHPCLRQVRINTLVDGKNLLVPTAGLKEGFVLLRPHRIPFPRLVHAVSLKGQADYGERLDVARLAGLGIGLAVAAGGMLSPSGLWLGDGKGFLDLVCAILAECGGLAPGFRIVAAPAACLLADFTPASWDVRVNAELGPDGLRPVNAAGPERKRIEWQAVAPRRTRKITPLWQLRKTARRG